VEPSLELRAYGGDAATVEKTGGLFVPKTGQYLLRLEGTAPARLRLWGATGRVELSGGEKRTVELIQGWYGVELRGRLRTPGDTVAVALLGEDGAKAILFENSVFKFNDILLARDGVMKGVGAALDAAFKILVKEDVMTKEVPRGGPHSDDSTEDFTIKESFQELTPPSKDQAKP